MTHSAINRYQPTDSSEEQFEFVRYLTRKKDGMVLAHIRHLGYFTKGNIRMRLALRLKDSLPVDKTEAILANWPKR